jgi:hypothetical protein
VEALEELVLPNVLADPLAGTVTAALVAGAEEADGRSGSGPADLIHSE